MCRCGSRDVCEELGIVVAVGTDRDRGSSAGTRGRIDVGHADCADAKSCPPRSTRWRSWPENPRATPWQLLTRSWRGQPAPQQEKVARLPPPVVSWWRTGRQCELNRGLLLRLPLRLRRRGRRRPGCSQTSRLGWLLCDNTQAGRRSGRDVRCVWSASRSGAPRRSARVVASIVTVVQHGAFTSSPAAGGGSAAIYFGS